MSATISKNDLKFTIFGAGHDYTLADSGEGEPVFFSHPKVPLGSKVYAGQFYFKVLQYDENDETVEPVMIDAVKDDIAHCTFTPDIDDTFDTEGEVEVSVHYEREYIYPEATILVIKDLTQTIEVVDHGNIDSSVWCGDLYEDGYFNFHPQTVNTVSSVNITVYNKAPSKLSNIFWRASGLGDGIYSFVQSDNLTDISELETADLSQCEEFSKLFYDCKNLSDFSPVKDWDTSNVTIMRNLFAFTNLTDLTVFEKWNTSNVTNFERCFSDCQKITSLHGLENWDVSSAEDFSYMFSGGKKLTDISALMKWDVRNVETMGYMFYFDDVLTSLHGLENWEVDSLTNIEAMFRNCVKISSLTPLGNWHPHLTRIADAFMICESLTDLHGLENFDVSGCTSLGDTFSGCYKLLSLEGVENWDVSNVTYFQQTFKGCPWIEDLDALVNWDMSSATNTNSMFVGNANLQSLDGLEWDLSNVTNMGGMFQGFYMHYSSQLGKKVWENAYYYLDYEGNTYSKVGTTIDSTQPKDASASQNWTVTGSNLNAFDDKWSNRPTWN